jgi:opacity protein-like surface antigen
VFNRSRFVQWRALVALAVLFTVAGARSAAAQGYVSPTAGYNFGGDTGCLTATDCEDKNWNFGVALGALGSIFGFETEFTYANNFAGSTPTQDTSVLTIMGDFMLAPKITIVQPYGLVGIGLIRTSFTPTVGAEESDNNFGWNVGGGLIVYFNRHFGLKGDVRYFHAFDALSLLGFDLARDQNKIDFGRVGLGAVIKF